MTGIVFDPLFTSFGTGVSIAPAFTTRGSDQANTGVSVAEFTTVGFDPTADPADFGVGVSIAIPTTFGADAADVGFSYAPECTTAGADFDLIPDIGIGVSEYFFATYGETFEITFDGVGSSHYDAHTTFAADTADVGFSYAPEWQTFGNDIPHPADAPIRFLLFQGMGWLTMTIGFPTASTFDSAQASDEASAMLTIQARDGALARGSISSHLVGTNAVNENVLAAAVAAVVLELVAEANAVAADDGKAYFNMLLDAADVLVATGAVASKLTAICAVAIAAEVHDRADPIFFLTAEDAIDALDAAAIQRISMLAHALDGAVATASATASMRIIAVAEDFAAADDASVSALTGLAAAFDSGYISATIRVGNEVYSTYAMTLLGAAPSEYTNFDFNSYMNIRGHLYGTSAEGTFLLEGDDDAGEQIDASVRVGLSNLGTQLKKEVPYAYVGYTSNGVLLLKVSTTDKGTKKTNVYKLNEVVKDVMSDNRFRICKGLQSVYWDFELTNLDGADFELDTLKVWRFPLNRRK